MPITRQFRETVMARAQKDATFRRALLTEAIDTLLAGDMETAKSLLRDYINATVSFEKVATELNKDSKSLQRMLGPRGNPRMDNLVALLHALQKKEHIKLHVEANR